VAVRLPAAALAVLPRPAGVARRVDLGLPRPFAEAPFLGGLLLLRGLLLANEPPVGPAHGGPAHTHRGGHEESNTINSITA
jgi:hypothetical protein